jgi:DNA-binding NtrC family response regulator
MEDFPVADRPCAVVADDDFLIRMDAADMLEKAGFEPLEAAHADAALRIIACRHSCIQVLFTDVQMPGGSMNGFGLAWRVAASWPEIRVIVASGDLRPGPDDLPEGASFIPKPFSADLVYSALQEILDDEQIPDPLKQKGSGSR